MKKFIEDIEHPRFKLRMFGIPLSEDQHDNIILCYNESVWKKKSNVETSLNKKHSAIEYHFTIWNVAAVVCKMDWIPTGENLADAMKKRLSVFVWDHLFGIWTY